MKTYTLARPIGAVLLTDPLTATTLPWQSKVRLIGPAKQIDGFVEVECTQKRYAVFLRDLEDCGELTKTTGE